MKKIAILLMTIVCLSSCGGKSGTEIAQDICDCSSKANGMDPADPKRTEAQDACAKQQMEAWNKVKDDMDKASAFNKKLGECASEQIKKAFGK